MKIVTVGDAMIPGEKFSEAAKQLSNNHIVTTNWEDNWDELQKRRLVIEQEGPGVEGVPAELSENNDADIVLGLFAPFSAESMDQMDNLKLIGVARAGTENVDIEAATERGILVTHIMGRNAHAVSDFSIGMMLNEARNIAKAHYSIKNGEWRKTFSNSNHIPEMYGKTIGLVGFGYIGQLVAEKLQGFNVDVKVYDPYINSIDLPHVQLADKETVFREADFVSIHARLTEENYHLVGEKELSLMKPTAYLINAARSGLVDTDALTQALSEKKIAGAGIDVFDVEPIPKDHPLLELDNVTLTTHIAGTTTDVLAQSPYLLIDEVKRVLNGEKTNWMKNPEVIEQPGIKTWIQGLQDN